MSDDPPSLLDNFINASYLDERWKSELMSESLAVVAHVVSGDRTANPPLTSNPLICSTGNVEDNTEIVVADDTISAYDRAMKLLD